MDSTQHQEDEGPARSNECQLELGEGRICRSSTCPTKLIGRQELSTCDPEFFKHTQRLFLMLHERGLAYQADGEVNWDPVDRTVLANEQVDSEGRSWRSGAIVEKRKLKQWYFRISEFREALLNDLDLLEKEGAWPD